MTDNITDRRTGAGLKDETESSTPSCECSPECCGWSPDRGGPETFLREESGDWVEDRIETAAGSIPVVRTRLGLQDLLGSLKARFGIGRMSYKVRPGLYAVGQARPDSPVLVTSNYKLSFDSLRRELGGLDAWILVLDTEGINVWCAAGKGTFGTEELVRRIEATDLARVVSHRRLILPQLGAPGVAAHEVAGRTRFKPVYGPVRAADIKRFLVDGMTASPEMRRVTFGIKDRFVLTAIELTSPFKYLAIITAILFVLDLFGLHFISWKTWYPYLGAILIGGFIVPILLPWIPGRPFAWKGWLLGLFWAAIVILGQGLLPLTAASWERAGAYLLLLPAISSFLAMGFTGSSTYTSLSGVLKEMRYAVPVIIVSTCTGIIFLAVGLVRGL